MHPAGTKFGLSNGLLQLLGADVVSSDPVFEGISEEARRQIRENERVTGMSSLGRGQAGCASGFFAGRICAYSLPWACKVSHTSTASCIRIRRPALILNTRASR